MNVPHEKGTYSVIIALHGYVDPSEYQTIDYTSGAADDLVSQDYNGHFSAVIQLHHGSADSVTPVTWAEETCL